METSKPRAIACGSESLKKVSPSPPPHACNIPTRIENHQIRVGAGAQAALAITQAHELCRVPTRHADRIAEANACQPDHVADGAVLRQDAAGEFPFVVAAGQHTPARGIPPEKFPPSPSGGGRANPPGG